MLLWNDFGWSTLLFTTFHHALDALIKDINSQQQEFIELKEHVCTFQNQA